MFHPDRTEDNDVDLELVVESESETEARTASHGARRKLKGESDSSIKRFMADWSSDSDAPGDHGAESEPAARKAEGKRPRKDAGAAGSSKAPNKKTGADSMRPTPAPAAAPSSGPVLRSIPLPINLLGMCPRGK